MRSLLLLSLVLASCSPFQRDFRRAAGGFDAEAATADGPWVGEWRSEVNGHHGPLWCLVSPSEDRPGHHDFRYRAGWGVLQFGDYTHRVPTRRGSGASLVLDDRMELPGGFGTYRVEGTLTPATFDATYRSRGDHGTMTLRRPES